MSYDGPIWEGVYHSFHDVPVQGDGFDGNTWVDNSIKKMTLLREEVSKNSQLPPPSNYREALLPFLAAMLQREKKNLKILDFGGGLGFSYYQTIYALNQSDSVQYHIVEKASVCKAGKKFFGSSEEKIHFHTGLPINEKSFDIIHIGSTLHYIEDWKGLLMQLKNFSPRYLLIVDILAGNVPTFATAQYYYGSRIPIWFFNIKEVLDFVKSLGYELMFKSVYQPTILGVEQSLPTQNLPEGYRLKNACNLLFYSNF